MKLAKMILAGLVMVSSLSFAGVASAVPLVVGDLVTVADGPGSTGGGEFYLDVLGVGGSRDIVTFCLEHNEFISANGTTQYVIAGISTFAVNGGVSGGNPDPLSSETAFLYYMFTTNQLPKNPTNLALGMYSYNFLNDVSNTYPNALQNAIWYLEGEIASVSGLAASYVQYAQSNATQGKLYGVRALNLASLTGQPRQDMLAVPEPGTLFLLGTGLLALGLGRARRKE